MKGKCILCGRKLNENNNLLKLNNLPSSAQDIPNLAELDNDCGIELTLYQCPDCGLVQFDCEPVEYYKKVIRAGGETRTMVDLRNQQYSDFIAKYNLKGKKIFEVGCGRGEFLKIWNNFDVDAYGIEYNDELVKIACDEGLKVSQFFIDNKDSIVNNGPYDAFCQFNFLEHQPYPNDMLQGIYNNLVENGVGLVTVPSLEYILKYNGYYELIRDHIAYYSEDSLKLLFQKNGFEVLSVRTINRDTHEIIVQKRKKVDVSVWNNKFNILKEEFDEYISEYKKKNLKIAVWGASHQGFTLIPTMGITDSVEYIIDSAKFKQGLYAPASHLKIVSPDYAIENPVDSILIIAPGYTDEIASIIRKRFKNNIDIRTLRSDHIEKL